MRRAESMTGFGALRPRTEVVWVSEAVLCRFDVVCGLGLRGLCRKECN